MVNRLSPLITLQAMWPCELWNYFDPDYKQNHTRESHVGFTLLTCPFVLRCWITDINVHYIVNIGYYALVFLFTFTTFIILVSWLSCLKRSKGGIVQLNRNSRSIVSVLGLCCMLGVTWGFAFFAYGALQIPAYYIFTILNSFQGKQSGNAPAILNNDGLIYCFITVYIM